MSTVQAGSRVGVPGRKPWGGQLVRLLTTTDHKVIGKLYLGTSFAWFLVGGTMAMLIRSELAFPGQQVVNDELYNQLFTMHGTIMLLLFATPLFFGFGNMIMPLQIGSPDVAFPRLNMFSYWLYLYGSLIVGAGFLTRATRHPRHRSAKVAAWRTLRRTKPVISGVITGTASTPFCRPIRATRAATRRWRGATSTQS